MVCESPCFCLHVGAARGERHQELRYEKGRHQDLTSYHGKPISPHTHEHVVHFTLVNVMKLIDTVDILKFFYTFVKIRKFTFGQVFWESIHSVNTELLTSTCVGTHINCTISFFRYPNSPELTYSNHDLLLGLKSAPFIQIFISQYK